MNKEQEQLAEFIIDYHKKHNGVLVWDDLYYGDLLPEEWSDYAKSQNLQVIKGILKELGLIEMVSEEYERSTLTSKGFSFISFEKLREEGKEEKRIKQLSMEKLHLEVEELRNKLFDYDETKARAKRAEIGMIISVVLSAIAVLLTLIKK